MKSQLETAETVVTVEMVDWVAWEDWAAMQEDLVVPMLGVAKTVASVAMVVTVATAVVLVEAPVEIVSRSTQLA